MREVGSGRFRARCRFRDYDGAIRYVVRYGDSANKAKTALKGAVKQRTEAPGEGDLTLDSRVSLLADRWLADIADADLSLSTKARYRTIVTSFVVPAMGELRLRELTSPRWTGSCGLTGRSTGHRRRRAPGASYPAWWRWRCAMARWRRTLHATSHEFLW